MQNAKCKMQNAKTKAKAKNKGRRAGRTPLHIPFERYLRTTADTGVGRYGLKENPALGGNAKCKMQNAKTKAKAKAKNKGRRAGRTPLHFPFERNFRTRIDTGGGRYGCKENPALGGNAKCKVQNAKTKAKAKAKNKGNDRRARRHDATENKRKPRACAWGFDWQHSFTGYG